jgi:hypothetical protein
MRLSIATTGIIAHGHGDVKFAHFSLDLYLSDFVAKLFCDLEKPPASSSGVLFKNSGSIPLFEVVLKGKEDCVATLDTSCTIGQLLERQQE